VKLRLAALCAAALSLPALAGAAAGFRATFSAPTHTPKVNAHWYYTVRARRAGRPARATITSQIVDPYGGVHPVEFGCCKGRNVTNHPFRGVFRDHVEFPPESQGFKLTFRVIVRTPGTKRVLTYWVKPR